jgi:hypothetical protein
MTTIKLNSKIGKAKAGIYQVTNTFDYGDYKTLFFGRVMKNGNVSKTISNKVIFNSTLNVNAPSVAQLDKAIENGIVEVMA